MSDDFLSTLREEFTAQEGSFLLQLRCDFVWDKDAFERVTLAMRQCCKHFELGSSPFMESMVPRWLAEGFYYMATYVRGYTAHPRWQRIIAQQPEYYRKAYIRLDELADWFFTGRCPWIDEEKGWAQTAEYC